MKDPSSVRARRGPVLGLVWAVALGAAFLVGPLASSASGADSTPIPEPSATPAPTSSPVLTAYSRSLLRAGDFARQYTKYQCVGASLQTMRNMILSFDNRGPYLQKKLWRIARANSLFKADRGADPFGWTTATSLSAGYGRYVLVAADTMTEAVKAAAKGIATTGRPAGIIVWSGRHAWVISGFQATADPNKTDDYRVLAVRMADPLWPYYRVGKHTVYRPGTRIYMRTLRRHFTPYHDSRRDRRIEGQFVAIVPVVNDDAVPDGAWAPPRAPSATSSPPSPSPAAPTPTAAPEATAAPTATPDATPTAAPEATPTAAPTEQPTEQPSAGP